MSSSTLFNLTDFAQEAQAILDAAKKQADEMLAATREEIQKEKELKSKEGYEAGFEKGHSEGLVQGSKAGEDKKINEIQKEASLLIQNLENISKEFVDIKVSLLQKAEADLIELSLVIAEKIVKVSIEVNSDVVVENVKEAIRFTSDKTNIQIKLHSEDFEVVKKYLPELKKYFDELEHLNVIEHELVNRGGCIITSANGEVDQNITTQIEKIYQRLLSTNKANNS